MGEIKVGNYDSATPLLHWLKLHRKWQTRLKGKRGYSKLPAAQGH
jgi:hypothetical protein